MTALGIVLLVLGLLLGVSVLVWIGALLILVGLVFLALHFAGRSSGIYY